ncbi:MAG: adenylate/guanylate cyclase domain-containing protein, partial [Pseudomonadota bacterium]
MLAIFLALRQSDPYFVKDLRNRSFDIYQQIKPREYSPQPVRVVDLDEQSLRELGQWPWPRTTIAQLIDRIGISGAAVIAFDIVFAEKDRLSPRVFAKENPALSSQVRNELQRLPDNELVMRDAIGRNRVVLGETSIRNANDRSEGSIDEQFTPTDAPFVQIGEDPRQFLHTFTEIVANLKVLDEVATGRGMFSIEQDADGIIRRLPLVMNVENSVRFALSAEALRLATGGDSFAVRTTVAGLEGLVIAGQLVSTDPKGNIWPYFTSVPQNRYIPAADILSGEFDPDLLHGHIVLVGTSAVGLEDYRSIPLGKRVPGVEIHAQVIENLLTGEKLERPFFALLYELAAIALVGLVMVFAVPLLGAGWSAVLAAVTIFAMIAASWTAFSGYRVLLDATWPVLTTLALFLMMAVFNYLREERQKQQIRSAFGQYLSPALVKRLSDNPEHLALGGTTRELSVLFTDIRGFTTLSESYRRNPQGLTRLMNRFLTVLSQPILDRYGTIDKYMGDGLMA